MFRPGLQTPVRFGIELGRPYLDFSGLFPEPENQTGITSADCAPAVAVACLANKYDNNI